MLRLWDEYGMVLNLSMPPRHQKQSSLASLISFRFQRGVGDSSCRLFRRPRNIARRIGSAPGITPADANIFASVTPNSGLITKGNIYGSFSLTVSGNISASILHRFILPLTSALRRTAIHGKCAWSAAGRNYHLEVTTGRWKIDPKMEC
jgi:hypothetical protein